MEDSRTVLNRDMHSTDSRIRALSGNRAKLCHQAGKYGPEFVFCPDVDRQAK